ncbi:conserved hypothetical protein [Sporisorium reilianum SRZ2]|uniref:Uncharacterized protein n=1 Tax=Sporisorium reilianum (strain SRZ2) TaxID=999809 RepID=E6ZQ57_SPORE|nr:conserved hypothetical protein [Sporisorium reilianum SRZ2]
MSAASTQQPHHACSGGCSPVGQSYSSSPRPSRHQSPVPSPTAFDHPTTTPSRPSSQGVAAGSASSMRQSSSEPQQAVSASSTHSMAHRSASTRSSSHVAPSQASHMAAPVPSSSTSSQPHPSSSAQPSQQLRLPTAAQRRRARELATVLLTLANCSGCHRPVTDPVTLPCGHSSCLQCIKDGVLPKSIPAEDEVEPLPCLSHLPPRLPLSPMTVPCPAHGCPRSAIGRGIGVWAGHRPRYGLIPTYTERLPLGAQDVGPGAPPVDGFVMGVADHPLRLTVIGPQTRSKAHLFAVPPQGVEPTNAAGGAPHQTAATLLPSLATSNMLRTDVTLSKAVAILMRYASSPLPRPPRQRRSLQASSGSSASNNTPSSRHARISGAAGASRDPSTSTGSSAGVRARAGARSRRSTQARSGARSQAPAFLSARRRQRPGMSHAGMGIFGQNESELESGTVGGVRAAVSDSDDGSLRDSGRDSSADTSAQRRYLHCANKEDEEDDEEDGWTGPTGTDDERSDQHNSDHLWPDRVGGAYSRPPLVSNAVRRRSGKDGLKRRRGRRSDASSSSANSSKKLDAMHGDGKVAKTEVADAAEEGAARHLDSGWSTEESTASPHLHREHGREALVDAVRRRRAQRARGSASAASDADTDLDRHNVVADAHKRAVEAKHSLALSSRVGLNGEPLIQSVATLHSELVEVLECQLCYLLLYDPLTTPCGHTFCKSCFARSLDHGDRCPLCRADMPNFSFFQDHRPNAALLKVLTSDTATFSDEDAMDSDSTQDAKNAATSTFAGISVAMGTGADADDPLSGTRRAGFIVDDDPESAPHHYGFKRLYEQRKAAIEQEEREARLSTPIFVCTLAFPGMPTILHIFEPRYRLMVRRCLESGNPRFGMVLPSRTNGGTEEYGTMLEIKSVQMLADGRSMLETVGSYRFRLLEKGSLDGYTVGRVERVDDISLEEEAELERAVLLRRTELERKKAAEAAAAERPRACPMAPSSSAPVRMRADAGQGGEEAAAASDAGGSARPEMSRAESDALSIYRTSTQAPSEADASVQASGQVGAEREGDNGDEDADENGLLPFKPVPAEPSIEELADICTSFIETLRSGSAPWLLSRLNHTYGPMPSADEVERLGYWMALVMPIDEHEKAKLLPIRSRRLRLCLVVHWIEQLRQSWWFNSGCTVS